MTINVEQRPFRPLGLTLSLSSTTSGTISALTFPTGSINTEIPATMLITNTSLGDITILFSASTSIGASSSDMFIPKSFSGVFTLQSSIKAVSTLASSASGAPVTYVTPGIGV